MKSIIITLTILLFVSIKFIQSQVTYIWVGGTSGNFTTAVNWSPTRANGQVSDILVFNCGNTVFANNVQQQTIGQLIITNNTHVIFTPASGNAKVLSINGGIGDDLRIDSNSTLEIKGNSPQLGILFKTNTTGSIYGSIIVNAQQSHYINAIDANSITFHSGSSFIQNSIGYVFTNAGTSNIVNFEDGSTFIIQNSQALTPFGLSFPSSKVNFSSNSNFVLQVPNAAGLNLNGRTYGNIILDMKTNVQINESFSSDATFNNINIKAGSGLNINNSNINYIPSLIINGDLTVNGNLVISNNITNNFKIKFSGSNLQNINGNGQILLPSTLTDIEFNSPSGLNINNTINAGCNVLVNTNVNLVNSKLFANTTVNNGGSFNVNKGYVVGKLTKYFNSYVTTQKFEIGTENGYTPVTITFDNVTGSGFLTVSSTAHTQPQIQDSSMALKRYWTINNNGVEFNHYSILFTYLSFDFNTNFIETTDESKMVSRIFGTTKADSRNSADIYDRDTLDNVIGLKHVENFGDFTFMKDAPINNSANELLKNSVSNVNSSKNVNTNSVSKFNLSQNYPNPFNPKTKIDYDIPISSNVSMVVYDINGREVSVLVNQFQSTGHYTIEFGSQNISSGVYFYKIIATNGQQNFEKTIKMIVSK